MLLEYVIRAQVSFSFQKKKVKLHLSFPIQLYWIIVVFIWYVFNFTSQRDGSKAGSIILLFPMSEMLYSIQQWSATLRFNLDCCQDEGGAFFTAFWNVHHTLWRVLQERKYFCYLLLLFFDFLSTILFLLAHIFLLFSESILVHWN